MKDWRSIIFNGAITFLGCLIVWAMSNKRADSQAINSKIEKCATTEYVDKRDAELNKRIDTMQNIILSRFDESDRKNQILFIEIRNQLYKK